MKKFRKIKHFQEFCFSLKKHGSIGFVPTMGCLHEGHLSLIRESKKNCDYTIVSVFVNPLQFGQNEDFNKYPRPWKQDAILCKDIGVTALFIPDQEEFYPNNFSIIIKETDLTNHFCGKHRKGHFDGVVTVVAKLLNIINPDLLVLGQKDYQQCLVLERLIKNMCFPCKIKMCPTLREGSGLAMSSRNTYLNSEELKNAAGIYRALLKVKAFYKKKLKPLDSGDWGELQKCLQAELKEVPSFKCQYAEIVCAKTLRMPDDYTHKAVILVAGFMGKTRLIDNILL